MTGNPVAIKEVANTVENKSGTILVLLPIMLACSRHPRDARPSWSPARDAAEVCRLAGRNFRFNPSRLSVPCCGELRRYLPSEISLGRPDQLVIRQQRSGGVVR